MTTAPAAREPLDPASPEGALAERRLNTVLASVMTRLQREARDRTTQPAPATPRRTA